MQVEPEDDDELDEVQQYQCWSQIVPAYVQFEGEPIIDAVKIFPDGQARLFVQFPELEEELEDELDEEELEDELDEEELEDELDEEELEDDELEEVDGHCPGVYCLMPSLFAMHPFR